MSQHHPDELELFARISFDDVCCGSGLTCALRRNLGVLLIHEGRPIGSWQALRGRLHYRSLCSATHVVIADSIDDAATASLSLVKPN